MSRRVRLVTLGLALLFAARVPAQSARTAGASAADEAIAAGHLDQAEEALFAASSRATHEPSARGALGSFLASRGRFKIGTVLLEEARQFGGDPSVIDARLARIFVWNGDWAGIAALKHYAPSGAEHDRARWMGAHPPAHAGPDSVIVPLEPNDAAGMGRITLSIGGTMIQADIDPNAQGLVLPSTPAVSSDAQQFGMADTMSVAVIRNVGVGALHLSNVPARLSPVVHAAIGFDILAVFTPTFDAASRLLILRERGAAPKGESLPILLSFPGVRFLPRTGQPPVTLESAAGRAALRGTRWTFDVKHGAIVVER
jgi:hypothetical protein